MGIGIRSIVVACCLCAGAIVANASESASLDKGVMLLKMGNVQGAIELLQKATAESPQSFSAFMALGNAYYMSGDYGSAQGAFVKAVALRPTDIRAQSNLASSCVALRQYDKAIGSFAEILLKQPDNAEIHNNLAAVYQLKGEYPKAIASFEKSISLVPTEMSYYVSLGKIFELTGDKKQAIKTYERALVVKPKAVDIIVAIGAIYKELSQYDKAENYFLEALKINPSSWVALHQIGALNELQGSLEKALSRYFGALKSNPGEPQLLRSIAMAYQRHGDVDACIGYWRQLLAVLPADANAHGGLGTALFAKKDYYGAADELKIAAKSDTGSTVYLTTLGKTYLALNRAEMAKDCFAEIIGKDPDNLEARLQMGILEYQSKNWGAAEKYLQGVLALNTASFEARYYIGMIYLQKNKFVEAQKEFEELRSRYAKDSRVFYGLGCAANGLGNIQQAIDYFGTATKLNDKYLDAHWELGKCYERANYRDMAYKSFKKILMIDPEFSLRDDIKKKLIYLRDQGVEDKDWKNF